MKGKENIEAIYRLSPLQQGMLFHMMKEPDSGLYMGQAVMQLSGEVTEKDLRKTFEILIERQPIMRTGILYHKLKEPVQVVRKEGKPEFRVVSADTQKSFEQICKEELERSFDFSKDTLSRFLLVKKADGTNEFVWTFHHIILDAYSVGILSKEILEIYEKVHTGQTVNLAPAVPYQNYIDWMEQRDSSGDLAYWENYLAGYEETAFLTEYGNDKEPGFEKAEWSTDLDQSIYEQMQNYCKNNGVTMNSVFLSLWGLLLQRYTNKKDVVFGTVVSGRSTDLKDAEKTAGLFINTVPVRYQGADMDFTSLVQKKQKEFAEAYQYWYTPLQKLQKTGGRKGELFNHLVVFENYMYKQILEEAEGIISVSNFRMTQSNSYPFVVAAVPDKQFKLNFTYNSRMYTKEFVADIVKRLEILAAQVFEHRAEHAAQISLMTEKEKHIYLLQCQTQKELLQFGKNIPELFMEQEEKYPDKEAVADGKRKFSYRELSKLVEWNALKLQQSGVREADVVPVFGENSIESVVAALAVLRAGAVYLPIDPEAPQERISKILGSVPNCGCIFAEQKMAFELPADAQILTIDMEAAENVSAAPVYTTAESPAYIMCTSGSTGTPKSVKITQKGIIRLVFGQELLKVTDQDKILKGSTPAFDASTFEIYAALLHGGSLRVVEKEEFLDTDKLKKVIRDEQITIGFFATSLFTRLVQHDCRLFNGMRCILTGGDVLSAETGTAAAVMNPDSLVINGYGPTENTTFTTWHIVRPEEKEPLPIGKRLVNSNGYVLDCFGNLQCPGLPGELFAGGPGVAVEYVGNEALTQEYFCFVREVPGERLYRTGDFVWENKNAELYFLGRKDNQTKIRGYRVELEEIQTAINKLEGVDWAEAVIAKPEGQDKQICAFYTSAFGITEEAVRGVLQDMLPNYMLPTVLMKLTEIPLKKNGKADKEKLKQLGSAVHTEKKKAVTFTEKKMLSVWREVLGMPDIGTNESFFALGGDSIKGMKLVSQSERAGLVYSLSELYQNQTIQALSAILDADDGTGIRKKRILPKELQNVQPDTAAKYEEFGCNDIQNAYIMGRSKDFELGGFSTHYYTELEGDVELSRLETALNQVIRKHAMLRTVLSAECTQHILKEVPDYKIPFHDVSSLSEQEKDRKMEALRSEMEKEIFRPDHWPLFRMEAFRVEEHRMRICFSIDILVIDAASLLMVERDLAEFYRDPKLTTEETAFSFRDYCVAMERFKKSALYEEDKKYWLDKINEFPLAPSLQVDTDCVKGRIPDFRRKSFLLEKRQWENIRRMAARHQVTPAAVLCTAYAMILEHWSGQKHFALDLTVFDRYAFHKEVAELVGDFTRIMLVEVDFRETQSFWNRVERISRVLSQTLEHSNYSGIEFMRDISNKYALGTKASMPYIFTCALYSEENKEKNQLFTECYSLSRTPQVYLDNQVTVKNGTLSVVWDYPEDIWERAQIDGMFKQYVRLLCTVGTEKEGEILLSETVADQYRVYNDTNQTGQAYEEQKKLTLNRMFLEAFEKYPDRIAVVSGEDRLTYKALDKLSDEVACRLADKKVPKKTFVAVEGRRCVLTLAGIIGTLKYGCAYVPINMEYPKERQEYIISHSRCKAVIGEEYLKDLRKEDCRSYQAEAVDPSDIAYVIFTSGSTGQPKGVVITHGAAANTIEDISERFGVTEEDCIIGLSSFGFDLSVYDIFGAFSTGAKLALVKDQRNVKEVAGIVEREQVTFWNSVPAVMEMFLTIQEEFENDTLKHVLLSGDWIPLKLPEMIRFHFKAADVTSLGGATEASVWSIYYPVPKILNADWTSIPYGMPLKNQQIYVMDERLNLCPTGVRGEICIGGLGVAQGYINDPDRTAAAFVEHPQYGTIYRTGDTGIFHGDYVEFTGRIDGQVKIRGFRIEIGEIEAKAVEDEKIQDAVVAVQKSRDADPFLVLYYTQREDKPVDKKELKERLEQSLPAYMIPAAFVPMKQFPLSTNGKVDRKALPPVVIEEDTRYMQPENEKENIILRLWQQVLERENIGVRQNFFELGGNSIKAMQFISMAEKRGLKIQLPDIFRYNTIEQVAKMAHFSDNVDQKNAQRLKEWVSMMDSYEDSKGFREKYEAYQEKYRHPVFEKMDGFTHYFITGGAGFFAAHLIVEILMNSDAKVTALVRATEQEPDVEERLKKALKFYVPERNLYEEYTERITVLAGDVSDDNMGIDTKTFDWLSEHVDCIIHAATIVKHYGLWSVFEKINIQGTRHVTQLMESGREKQFVFISTLSAGYTLGRNKSDTPYTEDYQSLGEESDNFYIQSKINAEEVVEELASRGKQVKIFRLGFLVQSYERGIFQMNAEENALFQMLETILRIGHVPNMTGKMFDMSYVDYAAKAVFVLLPVREEGHIYHIFNPDRMSLGRFSGYCREKGMDVEIMEYDDFFNYVFSHLKELSNDMSHLLTLTMADGRIKQTLAFQYKCDKTRNLLKQLGIEWPKVTENEIEDVLVVLGYKEKGEKKVC